MARLVYLAAARRAIADISAYIERESASRAIAMAFADNLISQCEQLAELPGLLGRARPDLGRQYRSFTFGKYVIVMRYADQSGPRSHLYIVQIIHGARDIRSLFEAEGSKST